MLTSERERKKKTIFLSCDESQFGKEPLERKERNHKETWSIRHIKGVEKEEEEEGEGGEEKANMEPKKLSSNKMEEK